MNGIGDFFQSIIGGAGAGSAAGTAVLPGIGSVIGGIIGALGGAGHVALPNHTVLGKLTDGDVGGAIQGFWYWASGQEQKDRDARVAKATAESITQRQAAAAQSAGMPWQTIAILGVGAYLLMGRR